MLKGSHIIGKPIVAYDTGRRIGRVKDLLFDQNTSLLLAFLVREGGWFSHTQVLPLQNIQIIGIDAIIAIAEEALVNAEQFADIQQVLDRHQILQGTRILTTDGRNLGQIIDLYFDPTTGAIEGYEVSGGLFADAQSGRSFVPAPKTLKIGEQVAFVPSDVAGLIETQLEEQKDQTHLAQNTAQVKSSAYSFWKQLQATIRRLVDRSILFIEEKQIKHALGRPVTRVILDRHDQIILNTGEIITHQAIETARLAGVLDILLNSVGHDVPHQSLSTRHSDPASRDSLETIR